MHWYSNTIFYEIYTKLTIPAFLPNSLLAALNGHNHQDRATPYHLDASALSPNGA